MYSLPSVVPFFKNELLQSWIFRLSEANGFDSPVKLLNYYFYPNAEDYRNRKLLIDYRDDLYYFSKALSDNCLPSDLLLRLTTFTGTAPFMSKEQRQRYLCQCSYKGTGLDELFPYTHGIINTVKVCPECIRDEIKNLDGFYLHRSHQMPGVKVCWNHFEPLKSIDYSKLKSLHEIPEMKDIDDGSKAFIDLSYALFCHGFLESQFDFSTDTVAALIDKKLPGSGSFKERYKAFLDRYNALDPFFTRLTENINLENVTLNKIQKWSYLPIETQLVILYLLYTNIIELKESIPSQNQKDSKAFRMMADSLGYSLLSDYRNDVVPLRHNECGSVFMVSPFGFESGWRCPHCSSALTVQEQFNILVKNLGKGEYRAVTPFVSMNKLVTFHHDVCGKVFDTKARNFIYERQRCECNWKYSIEEATQIIEANEGFKLLDFTSANDLVTIQHKCGAKFSIYFHKFLQRPFCRVCERDSYHHSYTDEDFNKEIQSVAGDEYELVGHYNGPRKRVSILHKVCGTVHDYIPFFFLDGSRCPKCTPKMASEEKFIVFVKETSHGRYIITGKPTRNLYEITDTRTGKKQNLSRLRIIQEFKRPTPSPYLPMDDVKPREVESLLNRNDFVLMKLKELYPEGGLIFWDDVIEKIAALEESGGIDGLYQSSQILTNAHKLIKVAPKIYSFPGEIFSINQVIEEKYVIRSGRHIGFYRGRQYAEEIGLLFSPARDGEVSTARKVWNIATNMESAKTQQRKMRFLDCDIHIKGCPIPVTDDNWLILSALDFIIQYKQIVKVDEEKMLDAVRNYIKKNNNGDMYVFSDFVPYMNYKTKNIVTQMTRLIKGLTGE